MINTDGRIFSCVYLRYNVVQVVHAEGKGEVGYGEGVKAGRRHLSPHGGQQLVQQLLQHCMQKIRRYSSSQ